MEPDLQQGPEEEALPPPEQVAAEEGEVKLGANADLLPDPEAPVIELGDRIRLVGGRYDKTTGRVIYRSESEIHLMPDGLSDRALIFEINDEGFDPELGIESVEILKKRKQPTLIEILDLKVDQVLETFDVDGNPVDTFVVKSVNPEMDTIVVENEAEGELTLNFGFRGIEKDLPFKVIRGRAPPQKVPAPQVIPEGEAEALGALNEEEEVDDFEFLDDELEEAPADTGAVYLFDIPTSEMTYSAARQKGEAYTDLLSLNTPAAQELRQVQDATRVLTEVFFKLREAILRVSADGTPVGVKPTSIQTLVDALDTRLVALSRVVVDINKNLYHDVAAEEAADDPDAVPQNQEGVNFRYFAGLVKNGNEYLESSPDMDGKKFNAFMNGYMARFGTPWTSGNLAATAQAFTRDEDVFRMKAPTEESNVQGYPAGLPEGKHILASGFLTEIVHTLTRGLRAIRASGQVVSSGDEATVLAYVMFPYMFYESLSVYPQESIARDIEAGLKGMKSIREILKQAGEISEIPTATQPFQVSVEGGTLGNIPLREYLKALNLKMEGMGDVWPLQTVLGMREREWTIDQQKVLQDSIKETQDRILAEIIRQREELSAIVAQPPAVQGIQMVPEAQTLIDKLEAEPSLKEIQDKLRAEMPAYQNNDLALVGIPLRHYPELAFAQLSDQAPALTQARTQLLRKQYIEAIQVRQRLKERKAFAGQKPEVNNCPHVESLTQCRRIKDDNTQFSALSKLLSRFQGEKKDNWVWCNTCPKHLLCMHEVLQIYQFLRPGDAATLNRQIQLDFGGGQFQGYYICRVCGQPISEIGLDNHLEFDDEGRPMAGRAELVDTDALQEEEIRNILGPMADLEEPESLGNATKDLIYKTAKQVADKLFAPLTREQLITITDRAYGVISQIPTRERFIKLKKASKNKRGDVEIGEDYDIYINQALVCAVAAHTLILIQTVKPDIILRGTPMGCRSLGGQPLEEDGGTQGIQCIVNVLSSFQKETAPWNLTQFQRIPDDVARQKSIMGVFEPILKSALNDPAIQQALAQKREYRRKILGAKAGLGRPTEKLPANFAPVPYEMKPEEFVEKVIIPEAATMADRADLWVRQGNFVAKREKLPMPLAFTEASCCLAPIEKLDEFWKQDVIRDSLPDLPPRLGVPPPPKYAKTEPTMTPPELIRPLPDPPEESYYQLFLRVCYDGERKGMTHEFGLTHKCMWCGLQLPAEGELLTAQTARAAIEGQGVVIDKESFEDLLDETHRVNTFKTKLNLEAPGPLDTWISLMSLEPEPAEGYRAVMAKTQAELAKLPPGAKEEEVALALADFSLFVEDLEQKVKVRLPPSQHASLDSIVADGPETILRFMQSYALVPIKQVQLGKGLEVSPPKGWGLADNHKRDIVTFMMNHRAYLTKFSKVSMTPWLNAKINTLVAQARPVLDRLAMIREIQVPGGLQTYNYFLRFALFAPLANFVDPNILPMAVAGVEAPASQVEEQAMFPARFVTEMVKRFMEEGFKFTPEQIREMIAARNEKEKAGILSKMSGMSRATKDIYMMNMRLGLGEFAHTAKEIYAYDRDRYDKDREQRAAAGIMDFPGFGPEGPAPPGGREADGGGFFGGGEGGEGYIGAGDLADVMGFDEEY